MADYSGAYEDYRSYKGYRSNHDTGGAIDLINHPPHYTSNIIHKDCGKKIECIDVVENSNFNIGNVIKYAWRSDLKGAPIEDLRKAIKYLEFEIARRERENP